MSITPSIRGGYRRLYKAARDNLTLSDSRITQVPLPQTISTVNKSAGQIVASVLSNGGLKRHSFRSVTAARKRTVNQPVDDALRECTRYLGDVKRKGIPTWREVADYLDGGGALPSELEPHLKQAAKSVRAGIQIGAVDSSVADEIRRDCEAAVDSVKELEEQLDKLKSAWRVAKANQGAKLYRLASKSSSFTPGDRAKFERVAATNELHYRHRKSIHGDKYHQRGIKV